MMTLGKTKYRPSLTSTTILVLAVAVLIFSGCAGSSRDNKLRPPAPIIVSVSISDDKVSASPSSAGAGPTTFKIINLSSTTQRLTIRRDELERSTGDFDPEDTATLSMDLKPGDYELAATDTLAIAPERFRVTKERPSSQNDLLLP